MKLQSIKGLKGVCNLTDSYNVILHRVHRYDYARLLVHCSHHDTPTSRQCNTVPFNRKRVVKISSGRKQDTQNAYQNSEGDPKKT